jgi:hypothetical protein
MDNYGPQDNAEISWSCFQILSKANFDFGSNHENDKALMRKYAEDVLPRSLYNSLTLGPDIFTFFADNQSQLNYIVRSNVVKIRERSYDQAIDWLTWKIATQFKYLSKGSGKEELGNSDTSFGFVKQALEIGSGLKVNATSKISAAVNYCYTIGNLTSLSYNADQTMTINWLEHIEAEPEAIIGVSQDKYEAILSESSSLKITISKQTKTIKAASELFAKIGNINGFVTTFINDLKEKQGDPPEVFKKWLTENRPKVLAILKDEAKLLAHFEA